MVPELVVPVELPIVDKIHHMAASFHTAQEEATKSQWDLNLQMVEIRMKVQPPTPPKIQEQCCSEIQVGLEVTGSVVQDCLGFSD